MIDSIDNFIALSPHLSTSGQPNVEQLLQLGSAGYRWVINLGLIDTDYAVQNEADLLQQQGINYIHIPVPFNAPQLCHFRQFTRALRAVGNDKVLVHCARNMRVSTFVALYRVKEHNHPLGQAWFDIREIWEPNEVWAQFIAQVIDSK